MKYWIFVLVLCINVHVAHATGQVFANLGSVEGLANGYVTSLAQDNLGLVYVATRNGLARFDGYRFTMLSTYIPALQDKDLQTLFFDSENNCLWIGGTAVTVMDIAAGSATKVIPCRGKEFRHVYAFAPSAQGQMWIAATGTGIVRYDHSTGKSTSLASMGFRQPASSALCLYEQQGRYLYVGYGHDGLWRYDLRGKKRETLHISGMPGNSVYKIVPDGHGRMWIATNAGLAVLDTKNMDCRYYRNRKGDPGSVIADHIFDLDVINNRLWIAADIGGISILSLDDYDKKNVRFANITSDGTQGRLSSKNIRAVMGDRFGNVWIGNYGSGIDIMRHDETAVNLLRDGQYLSSKPSYATLCSTDGSLWIGGENELRLYKGWKLEKTYDLSSYLQRAYSYVSSIAEVENGQLLLGMYDSGLLKLDKRTGKVNSIPFEKDYIDVNVMLTDKMHKTWIGTENGLYFYSKGQLMKAKLMNKQIGSPYIQGLAIDKKGRLWVGTGGKGIFIFNANGRLLANIFTGTKSKGRIVNSMCTDRKGRVYAATTEGLVCFDNADNTKKFKFYDSKDGIENPFMRAVVVDGQDNLWTSTDKGIYVFDKKTRSWVEIPVTGGNKYGNFSTGGAALANDGQLLFTSKNGTIHCRPEMLMASGRLPRVVITECSFVDDDASVIRYGLQDSVKLPRGTSEIAVKFSVADYSLCKGVEYAYQIEELGKEWKSLGRNHSLHIDSLEGGTYTLKLIARKAGQSWNKAECCSMVIVVPQPAWLSAWAVSAYIAIIFVLAVWSYCRYLRKGHSANAVPIEQITTPRAEDIRWSSVADKKFLDSLTQLIEKNIANSKLDIQMLSSKMNVSQSTLYRRVRSLTGMTCNEYVRKVRLDNAIRLLKSGTANVSEAAYASGFNDLAHFRRCFKRQFGRLPSDYI